MPAATLQIVARDGTRPGHRILAVNGVISLETVPEFVRRLRAEAGALVILDFTQVPFMDSAGLGALVQTYVHFAKEKRRLALAGLNQRVQAVLEITRVQKLIPVFANADEAETRLG